MINKNKKKHSHNVRPFSCLYLPAKTTETTWKGFGFAGDFLNTGFFAAHYVPPAVWCRLRCLRPELRDTLWGWFGQAGTPGWRRSHCLETRTLPSSSALRPHSRRRPAAVRQLLWRIVQLRLPRNPPTPFHRQTECPQTESSFLGRPEKSRRQRKTWNRQRESSARLHQTGMGDCWDKHQRHFLNSPVCLGGGMIWWFFFSSVSRRWFVSFLVSHACFCL